MAQNKFTDTPIVAANGTAATVLRVRNGLDTWTVTQISARLPSAPMGATADVNLNGFPVSPFVPTGDTVGGDPPVTLLPSDVLTIAWAGCTPGTVAQVQIFYDDGRG